MDYFSFNILLTWGMADHQTLLKGRYFSQVQYRQFSLQLRKELIEDGYIDEVREDEWICLFEGGYIDPDDQFTFRWLGQNNHCIYLFDKLSEDGIIQKRNLDVTLERFFGLKGVAEQRYSMFGRKIRGKERIDILLVKLASHIKKLYPRL